MYIIAGSTGTLGTAIVNALSNENELFLVGRDEAKLKEQKEGVNANNKKPFTPVEVSKKEKVTSEIEAEAESINASTKVRQKQLDIKDINVSASSSKLNLSQTVKLSDMKFENLGNTKESKNYNPYL